ncbi:hypothetical protein G9C85_18235 [Halorubellus sp. JP-L1]|uniref:hypothetical protein n=1 Tax=Halorubellus sp. JP-L1 TaxID=2715753 RepID=UPI001407F082|nr:hypothetical protein [Halorubellus sp. JP-L1]NHN43561.1 hypothetical protein [Halorubellus sp. JP-L1]
MTATLPRRIAVGDRPRAAGFGLLAALLAAAAAASLRVLDPTALLGVTPSFLAAAVGGSIAAAVGRYRGGVLAGILAAALPVFAVDAATVAVRDPVTLQLVARAAASAAWYTTGVAVLLAGPLGYALGALSRPDRDRTVSWRSLRPHCRVAPEQATPLAAWIAVALGTTTVATAFSLPLPTSPTAASPVPAAAALAVAADLGRRAPRALASAVAGCVGVTVALHLYAQNFVVLGPNALDVPTLDALALFLTLGFLAGAPLGLVGYIIGRTLAH